MTNHDPKLRTFHHVWLLAWPMILSNLSVPLLGMVDTAMLGHLDNPQPLAAVALGASILSFLLWGFGFLRMGTTSLMARAYGADNQQAMSQLLNQGIFLGLVIGASLALLSVPITTVALTLMDVTPALTQDVTAYCHIRLLSAPAVLINYTLIGVFIGLQNTRAPLQIMVLSNLVNIFLDAVFIFGLNLGSAGAATATVLSDLIGLGLALYLLRPYLLSHGLQLNLIKSQPWRRLRGLLSINTDLFIRTASLLFTLTFFTAQSGQLGPSVLAANAIMMQLLMLVSHGLDGFAHTAEALVGEDVGRSSRQGFLTSLRATAIWSALIAGLFCLLFGVFQPWIPGWFTHLPGVLSELGDIFGWIFVLILVSAPAYWLDGVFLGSGATRWMLVSALVACGLVFFPLWYLTQAWGNQGLWVSLIGFNASRSLVQGCTLHSLTQKLR